MKLGTLGDAVNATRQPHAAAASRRSASNSVSVVVKVKTKKFRAGCILRRGATKTPARKALRRLSCGKRRATRSVRQDVYDKTLTTRRLFGVRLLSCGETMG
jgi:hypothetical protein